ncbi:MAG TPA: Na+/H+ antiporter, partial [Myxococcaceae bacterium]|nr:Na+/H+ antiporter [Myxococcaceae bacterium]
NIPSDVLWQLEQDYQRKGAEAEQELSALKQQSKRFHEEEHQEAVRRMLYVEKEALLKSYQRGAIGKESFEHLTAELDERLAQAKAAEHAPASAPAQAATEGAVGT